VNRSASEAFTSIRRKLLQGAKRSTFLLIILFPRCGAAIDQGLRQHDRCGIATILNAVGLDYPKECAGGEPDAARARPGPFEHPPIYGRANGLREVNPFVRPDQNVDPELKKYMIITQDGLKLIYNRDYYSFSNYTIWQTILGRLGIFRPDA